ncbi:AAA family ATPase [Tissierella sp.]|uniref:AAA family ATPase n=1 Tax=Tissierella sp. TaxID=41274 RepID=UPI00285D6134|nr:hypothetical protein [Tissierella sp.]MDR7856024.1 hypothetical protein [Tissierella sp.]
MNIKLNYLHLKNFKGIKDFKLTADGKNVSVFADNGKGKTTLMDGFLWLLFSKDSNDNTTFTVKPQDELGQDIHHLQTEVEAEMLIDGKPLKIKKMQEEKWVTKRGSDTAELTGNTASYWYDEVPQKATEYKEKIDSLINENIFKMITNPLYFNTKLKWEERRKILLEISGNRTDEEVIASDEGLSKLTDILNGKSIEDYKLVLADKLKGFKKERDNLPPRIDELTRSLPQEEPDYTAIEEDLKDYRDELATVESMMTNAANKTNELNKKHQELYSLKSKLEEVKAKVNEESGTDIKKLIDKKTELQGGQYLIKSGIDNLKMQIDDANRTLEFNSVTRQSLLNTWRELNDKDLEIRSEEFIVPDLNKSCPTCGRDAPEEIIESQMEELKVNFEKEKNSRLSLLQCKINANKVEGTSLKERTEKAKSTLDDLKNELSVKEGNLKEITITIDELNKEISKPVPEPDYSKYADYTVLFHKMYALQAELDKPVEDKSSELLARKSDIQAQIDELNKILNGKSEVEKKKARIEELKAEEKRVSSLIAELEGHKFLLERFTVAKVNLLEDSINSQFKHVKFKLFEENITNDGIKDTCIALVNTNGAYVKFEDGNLAGKINAGLDIIQALSKFYGVMAPIFVDNRESVSKIMETDSQIINLIKPPTWDELDKEVQDTLISKYGDKETAKKIRNDRNKTLRVEVRE